MVFSRNTLWVVYSSGIYFSFMSLFRENEHKEEYSRNQLDVEMMKLKVIHP